MEIPYTSTTVAVGATPLAQTFTFPGVGASSTSSRRLHRAKRPLGNKLQEIADRSPKDLAAFEVLADLVLARLNLMARPPNV